MVILFKISLPAGFDCNSRPCHPCDSTQLSTLISPSRHIDHIESNDGDDTTCDESEAMSLMYIIHK